jgi:hypothetical protein
VVEHGVFSVVGGGGGGGGGRPGLGEQVADVLPVAAAEDASDVGVGDAEVA